MGNRSSVTPSDVKFEQKPVRFGSPELHQAIDDIGRSFAQSERDGTNPHTAIDLVRQSRLGALRVPRTDGGGGCSVRELFATIIDLAEVAPDIPHILRTHFWFVEDRLRSTNVPERTRWLERIAAGDIFGNAVTELGGSAAVGTWVMQTKLLAKGDGFVLNGKKYYVTGSLYSDWISVQASNEKDEVVASVIPTNREGVTLEDDWDGIGQRRSGSGTGIFTNVAVKAEEVLQESSAFTTEDSSVEIKTYVIGQLCQLILTAIIVGIMRNVVTDAVEVVRGRARTYSHGSAETAAADPLLQETIGRISTSAMAAEAVVLAAAEAQDASLASMIDGVADFELAHRGSVLAAQAKVIVDELAPRAATLLFDVGGSSAIKQSVDLDRHWRNIRTLSSHNPTVYKARALGDYLVNDASLPINGFF
jgi:alkylation response protein AidB-like acyl-CoA dehydrogenase